MQTVSAAPADLFDVLKAATDEAHRQLERRLDLLGPQLALPRVRTHIARFYGFHRVWEPAVRRHADLDPLLGPRSRLAHLEADLADLGLDRPALEALPLCSAAAKLVEDRAAAIGSLYVVEGATLGGLVIARALEPLGLPGGVPRSLRPYGRNTGALWRDLRAWCESAVSAREEAVAVEGARATFALLAAWLPSGIGR